MISKLRGQWLMPRVRELLDRRIAGNFVGRTEELGSLLKIVNHEGPVVVHLHGIAGVGKSRLLAAFAEDARALGATVIQLDCCEIEPTETVLLNELGKAIGEAHGSAEQLATRLGDAGSRVIVTLDTFEVFRLMDTWLRQVFLPMLPDNVRFVLCGREAPVTAWLSDPGWQSLFKCIQLESLKQQDAAELLSRAGITGEDARFLSLLCHGHPLALTLAASMQLTLPMAFNSVVAQRVVEELSSLFLGEITDAGTRHALEAASVVRRVTRPILRALLPDTSPVQAQECLRSLPFIQPNRDGLHIHDAVREAIATTLRANHPQQYHAYRRSAHRYFISELRNTPASELWRYTADLLYLLENPVVREGFFPSCAQEYVVEPARPGDASMILESIDRHENSNNAKYMKQWWSRVPETFMVARDQKGQAAGFYCVFDPADVPAQLCQDDPVTRAWLDHLKRDPVIRQHTLFLRRWLSVTDGESPSPVQAACWIDIKRKYLELRPNLRRVYLMVVDLAPYAAAAQKLGFRVIDEACGRGYQSAMLDFGPSSVDGWLARLLAAELGVEDSGLIDCVAHELVLDGKRIGLSKLEFGVLEFLYRRPGEAVSRSSLLAHVWEQSYNGGGNVVDVVIRSIRKKLGDRSSLIETVHGIGYRFRREDAAARTA
jgi:hypothetical protein